MATRSMASMCLCTRSTVTCALGRRLYDARKEICENLNLRGIIAGGRIPGYKDYADKLTPAKYIEMVRNKELSDPVLSFQLATVSTCARS
jgi:hypothetical protein